MRIVRFLLILLPCGALLSLWPDHLLSAAPFGPSPPFDRILFADVAADALAFIGPRTLEPVPTSRLTLWGLRGLATLDAGLRIELAGLNVRLLLAGRPVLEVAAPDPSADTAGAWAELASQIVQAAWNGSDAIRAAGPQGVTVVFFDELFSHLDPYSRYIAHDAADVERAGRQGRVELGLVIAMQRDGATIQSVAPGSPAARAGLRAGERLLSVDGESTEGAEPAEITALLDGPDGGEATLEVLGRDGHVRQVVATRELVVADTVAASRSGDLLVLRISGFNRDTGDALGQAISHAMAGPHPPKGLVIDLRGNRGGLLRQAVDAARDLLDGSTVPRTVVRTVGRDPAATRDYTADGPDLARGRPAVVLVDGRTASAAEILAAALADQGRAVVVGSSTFGKGLVQTITTLPDGGDLFLTWSRVLAPLGWPIQELGVLPQVCTSEGEAAIRASLAELARGELAQSAVLARARAARPPLPPAEALAIRAACPPAEGREADLAVARFLIDHPKAYATAIVGR